MIRLQVAFQCSSIVSGSLVLMDSSSSFLVMMPIPTRLIWIGSPLPSQEILDDSDDHSFDVVCIPYSCFQEICSTLADESTKHPMSSLIYGQSIVARFVQRCRWHAVTG